LYPDHGLLHHCIEYVVGLRKHRHHTLSIEEQEEGQDHAGASPLAPSSVIVESEEYHDIRHNNTRTKHNMTNDPEANVLTILLQIVLTKELEGKEVNYN